MIFINGVLSLILLKPVKIKTNEEGNIRYLVEYGASMNHYHLLLFVEMTDNP